MSSFSTNMVQKYLDLHAKPIPDYPQPLTASNTWLKHSVFWGKKYGRFASVGNFGPAGVVIGAYFTWPYIQSRVAAAKAEAAAQNH